MYVYWLTFWANNCWILHHMYTTRTNNKKMTKSFIYLRDCIRFSWSLTPPSLSLKIVFFVSSKNIQFFILNSVLSFKVTKFLVEHAPPPWKSNTVLKTDFLTSPPFWKIGRRFNSSPPPNRMEWRGVGGCTLWTKFNDMNNKYDGLQAA